MATNGNRPSLFQRRAGLPVAILLAVLAALLIWLPVLFTCGWPPGPTPISLPALEDLRDGEKPGSYVAHGFGEIDGNFYTNSRDAFLLNYERGYRTFEVDLVVLQDGLPFCAHDESEWMYGLDKPFTQTTTAELSNRRCLGKYAPLTGSNLLDLIDEYTDARFFLDTKRTSNNSNRAILESLVSEAKERCPSALDRMIPHTFGPADLWEVAKIHRFRDYWVAVYSFRCNLDRSSVAEPDRVVLYIVSNGGPAGFRHTAGSKSILRMLYGAPLGALSRLRCPTLGLVPFPYGTRLYVSVDIMDAGAAPEPS